MRFSHAVLCGVDGELKACILNLARRGRVIYLEIAVKPDEVGDSKLN